MPARSRWSSQLKQPPEGIRNTKAAPKVRPSLLEQLVCNRAMPDRDPVATPFGTFTWNDPCWESEPVSAPVLGRAPVKVQIFDVEADDLLASDEVAALRRFLALPQERSAEIIPHLWRYYQDVLEAIGPEDITIISDPSKIWDHVQPRWVSLNRDEDGVVYISVESECDWEIEHGLQLVLQNGDRWVRVSDYSGHLTDGRAWGKRVLDEWMQDPNKTLPVRGSKDFNAARRDQK